LGHTVTVYERSSVCAADMGLPGRFRSVFDTEGSGVTLVTNATETEIAMIEADTVIDCGPVLPRRVLFERLVAAGIEAYAVGDCDGPPREGVGGLEAAFAAVGRVAEKLRRAPVT
jgi:hypothetical protein